MARTIGVGWGVKANRRSFRGVFIEKEVERLLKDAKKAAKMFDGIRAKLRPVRIKAGMGMVSQKIVRKSILIHRRT